MGILSRAFGRKIERKAAVDFTDYIRDLSQSTAGVIVTEQTALRLPAVFACIRVISEDVASLPLHVFEFLEPRGKHRAMDHPLYSVLHDQPNPEMSALTWRELLTAHCLAWGNGYSWINRDNRGNVRELWPLLPDRVRPMRDPKTKELIYEIYDATNLNKESRWIARSEDIFHLVGLGWDGLVGYSPIQLHRQAIGLGLAQEEYGARYFGQNTHIGGVLETPQELSEPAHTRLKKEFEEKRQGLARSHSMLILEGGMKWAQTSISPEDSQFVEARQLQVAEIARIFRLPPTKIGDLTKATYSNVEQEAISYVVNTLRPWLVRWEHAIRFKLFGPQERQRFFAEHVVEGLLRGDTAARYSSYAIARQWGWMSVNEIRSRENLDPIDGGDNYELNPAGAFDRPKPTGEVTK